MEFHTTAPTTGVDIAGILVDYLLATARHEKEIRIAPVLINQSLKVY
jgi:hypothetical protein